MVTLDTFFSFLTIYCQMCPQKVCIWGGKVTQIAFFFINWTLSLFIKGGCKCPKIGGSKCPKIGGCKSPKIGGSKCPKIGGSKCPRGKCYTTTCPHHEVTLDNFGFLVGAHSTAWWAVIRPYMAKMVRLGARNPVFWPKINFLETSSKFFDAIMAGHQKDNFFVLTASHGGPRGGRRGPFLAWKSAFFYATPI